MAEYPKEMAKGDQRRYARHLRDEVKFKFDGYKPVEPTGDVEPEYEAPQLPLAELVEKAEEAGVDVAAAVQSWETNGGATAKTKR